MTLVRHAVGVGYRNPDAYRTEDALDPLRHRDDFRLFLMDLAMPEQPFAAARSGARHGHLFCPSCVS
jgi:hypothetical protein